MRSIGHAKCGKLTQVANCPCCTFRNLKKPYLNKLAKKELIQELSSVRIMESAIAQADS